MLAGFRTVSLARVCFVRRRKSFLNAYVRSKWT